MFYSPGVCRRGDGRCNGKIPSQARIRWELASETVARNAPIAIPVWPCTGSSNDGHTIYSVHNLKLPTCAVFPVLWPRRASECFVRNVNSSPYHYTPTTGGGGVNKGNTTEDADDTRQRYLQ